MPGIRWRMSRKVLIARRNHPLTRARRATSTMTEHTNAQFDFQAAPIAGSIRTFLVKAFYVQTPLESSSGICV
jgi:hypothetical protein